MLNNSSMDNDNLPIDIKDIPIFAVYGDNDGTFKNSKSNAEKIASRSNK
jgi:hypothetical protein